ncbi:MAG: CsbD family protein [Candidatus Nanopelagicales bacterium]
MGTDDKIRHAVDEATGKVKEAAGKVLGDDSLENEGERDQSKADIKQATDDVKDAFGK